MQVVTLSLFFLPSVYMMSSSPDRGLGGTRLAKFGEDEICYNKILECVGMSGMPCWLRCRCRGYTSGICYNAPECQNNAEKLWKCKCWGKEEDTDAQPRECGAWSELERKEALARRLEGIGRIMPYINAQKR